MCGVVVVVMLVVEVVLILVGVCKYVFWCVRVVFLQLVFLSIIVLFLCFFKICIFFILWCVGWVVFVFVVLGDSYFNFCRILEFVLEVYFYSFGVLGQILFGGKCIKWEIGSVVGEVKEMVFLFLDVLFVLWSNLGFNGGK